MDGANGLAARPWWIVSATIGGLLAAIAAIGIVGVVLNEHVRDVTEQALLYDVELEDEGDDLRVAVLDLRHYHRNIAFSDPPISEGALIDHERAYASFLEELGELEQLDVSDLEIMQPEEMRGLAGRYYDDFRAAIPSAANDPQAFALANDEGLRRLAELERAAEEIDEQGEILTETSLEEVDRETNLARFVLLALLGGVALVGATVAVTAGRILARIRDAYAREQAASHELAAALRTKNDFIADASHELRTPLTVIRGNAEIGLTTPDAMVQREVLEEIAAEAKRMGTLVDDLLFLARSDAGAAPLEREYVPVHWLTSRIRKPAEALARQRGTCLTTDLNGTGHLEVDPARIEQVVLILVDNAAKHTPPGACVHLRARAERGELTIEVVDQGPGIPPEELPLIFDRFYQIGPRRARKKGGAGLGLSIARTIVQAHGGSIAADSGPGRGTRMTIRLPLSSEPELIGEPIKRLAPAHSGAASGSVPGPDGAR